MLGTIDVHLVYQSNHLLHQYFCNANLLPGVCVPLKYTLSHYPVQTFQLQSAIFFIRITSAIETDQRGVHCPQDLQRDCFSNQGWDI